MGCSFAQSYAGVEASKTWHRRGCRCCHALFQRPSRRSRSVAAIFDSLAVVLMGRSPLSVKRSALIVPVGGLRWHGVPMLDGDVQDSRVHLGPLGPSLWMRACGAFCYRHGRPDQSAERPYLLHEERLGQLVSYPGGALKSRIGGGSSTAALSGASFSEATLYR